MGQEWSSEHLLTSWEVHSPWAGRQPRKGHKPSALFMPKEGIIWVTTRETLSVPVTVPKLFAMVPWDMATKQGSREMFQEGHTK